MIAPITKDQHEYVTALAVHLLRAREQVAAGDKPGSVAFTAAFRALKTWGDGRYARENAGLVEWAEMLAAEEPDRIRERARAQEARVIAAAPEPEPEVVADDDTPEEPAPEPEPEPKPKRTRRARRKES